MDKIYYPAIFQPEQAGYSVSVPDIDGCFSEGDTLEEAIDMITDAIGLCLEDRDGKFPEASDPALVRAESPAFVSLIPFDMLAYRRRHDARSVKKTLTLPSWLNTAAEEKHINFSSVLQTALKQQLNID